MIWDAVFDGVRLGMRSMFSAPRRTETIIGTYGCLAYHSDLLRNGCPAQRLPLARGRSSAPWRDAVCADGPGRARR